MAVNMTKKIKIISLLSAGLVLTALITGNLFIHANMNNQITQLKEEIKEISSKYADEILQRENEISDLEEELSYLKQELSDMKNKFGNLISKINELEEQIKIQEEKIKAQENEITNREEEIEQLKKELSRYKASQNTNSGKSVYLTFDDGPSLLTPKVLDVLKEENVKATFFVIGTWALKYPDIIKRAHNEGHSVLCHTHTHQWSIYTSFDTYYSDLEKVESTLKKILGYSPPKIIRFPGGSTNQTSYNYGGVKFMNYLTKDIIEKGYYYIDWNVSSGDAGSAHSNKERIISNVKKWSAGKNLAVALFHDVGSNEGLVDALPEIIEYYRDNGFAFKNFENISQSELDKMVSIRVANMPVNR